ncbi:hypothetical protein Pcinc_032323 [Petrolisthes cinctipes]|uniref:Uncharacterized protein n=1 Tax=Petrolisthes cinctipes TaxID=88211 RepID=A0AAE1EUL1_PETCI|nr:hypothetical protein Pcinc_032323 [Petrolisthes cinctipes]
MVTSSNQPSVVHACPTSTHPPREYHPQKDKNVKPKSYLGTYVTHTCKPSCQLTSYQADIPSRICFTSQNRKVKPRLTCIPAWKTNKGPGLEWYSHKQPYYSE